MKSRMIFLSSMAIGLGLLFGGTGVTAQAVMTNDQILQTAPKGVEIDDYFSTGNITGNAAQISATGVGKRQAVNLTNGPNQAGAIWVSDAARMNLNEDQTVSMWMYFGDGRFSSSSGDGMAFVLQNDSNGVNAIAKKADGTPASGQSMGVWGTDSRTDMTKSVDTSAIARLAIQNSWAVEFDTTSNRDILPTTSQANAITTLARGPVSNFDRDVFGPHVASNFPGQAATYRSNQVSNYYYTSMVHEGVLEANKKGVFTFLDAGWWRHVMLKWDSYKHTMTYSYNDRTPVAGEEPLSATSAETQKQTFTSSVNIDPAKDLNVGSDGLVRWGFTGSTGSASSSQKLENNIVVFDQVPGLVDADVTASLVDNSQGNKNIDDASDVVYTGDQMTLRYHLNYKSGRDSWQNIQYKLNLPGGIEYSSAKITYDDGKQATGNDSETVNIKGQSVSETLARNLSNNTDAGETNGATITLTGIATSSTATASSPENIAATTSRFEGANAITQATLNGFQIKPRDSIMTMALTGKNITPGTNNQAGAENLKTAADVTVTGEIEYRTITGAPVVGKKITVRPRYNGTSVLTSVVATDEGGNGLYKFSYTISASDLKSGSKNIIELSATDAATNLSAANSLKYAITLEGTKSISVEQQSSFNTEKITGAAMHLQADRNKWSVKVYDSIGKGDHWTLQASATPWKRSQSDSLDDHLSLNYIGADHKENSLTQSAVNIETHTTKSDDDVFEVTSLWNDSRGLFLDVNPAVAEGEYTSKISWILADVENVS